ncbi:uncharacterized protein SCHCODRAFT_02556847 [Schizophyllum commune H4-8]|nr:uncharacterized protein SCHCODRAFT_02556847 [Schizophyllum commune H4-8]KAI5886208.1 hypothetical protein SCHCODRAFT_02556847 [Schizophyllum commune H4-8]
MDSVATSLARQPSPESSPTHTDAMASTLTATLLKNPQPSASNVEAAKETTASQYGAPYSTGGRVVSIYEIFFGICKLVLANGKPADLVPLVTVSRAASEVARDVLWEKQTEFGPLFRTIPRVEAKEIGGCRYICEPVDELVFSSRRVQRVSFELPAGTPKSLTDAEYATFSDYARRIKKFLDGFAYEDWKSADEIDPQLLGAVLERGPILPRVHTLRQGGGFKMAFTHHYVKATVFCRLQPASGDGAPAGLCLMKRGRKGPPRRIGTIVPLSNFRSLNVFHEHGDAFEQIASLRDLQHLDELHLTNFRADSCFDEEPARASESGFRSLRTLVFAGHQKRLHDARYALRAMSSEPLRLKALAYYGAEQIGEDDQRDAQRFHTAVRECVDHDSLTTLLVSTGRRGCVRAADLFADLCVFKNISRAQINFDSIDSKDADADGALDLLSGAWPKLEYLTFAHHAVTLAGLTPLARRCPALKALSAAIDMRCIPEPILQSQREVMSERRVELVIRMGTVPSASDDLMQFLDSIFPPPTLRRISAHRGNYRAAYDWDEFWTRMQERAVTEL